MGSWKRQLHLWHRWLGIAIGLLVLLWFGSGIVMMYVPYPALTEQERMAWLEPLDPGKIRVSAWDAWQTLAQPGVPGAVRLNSVAGRPAYHFLAAGRLHSAWADNGGALRVTDDVVAAAARGAVPGAKVLTVEQIELDQWTFGRVAAHRPLHRVTMDDAAGSVLYVSGRTGELVRDTTRSERAWNWAGAVIHWLYFTPLRAQPGPWRQAVMWTSAVALLLAMSGMVLGIQRLRLRRRYAGGARSPYKGWQAWHHWLGLSIGTLTLTWLFSGWLSVGPFEWLSSPGISAKDRLAFAGGPLDRDNLSVAVADAIRAHPGVLELEWRRVDGKLYLSALERTQRRLLDAQDAAVVDMLPLETLRRAVQATRPDAPLREVAMLTNGDNYYYSHHGQAALPVMRAQFQLADETTFYVDPVHGQLAAYADSNSKWNRWLFNGLHQLDFAPAVRARPVWDVLVISLCLLGAMLSATGVVLGWRRLRKRAAMMR
ncbi:MAG: PepSY domain-containing protein [Pseudomonadota bacterium]